LELSDRFGESDEAGIRITLKLKREDLAQMTAVTVETVVRLLHDFQENKLITVRGRELKILNADPNVTQAVPSTCALAGVPTCSIETNKKVQITMLTVNVTPKIMFMEGSRFRPWVIPVGLDFHVISPPPNDTTALDIGVQFAVGAQYRIWKAIHLGVDGRFHLATGQTDTTNNFGTAGAYVGIAF
jgi:hypothetical protein